MDNYRIVLETMQDFAERPFNPGAQNRCVKRLEARLNVADAADALAVAVDNLIAAPHDAHLLLDLVVALREYREVGK